MNELKIQHEYVMEFLCRLKEQGGLGYRSVSNIVVSNDLFIPSVMGEFVSNSQPETWTRLLKKYGSDEQALQTALKDKVKETLLDAQNVAIYMNGHKPITFEGEKITTQAEHEAQKEALRQEAIAMLEEQKRMRKSKKNN